MRDFPNREQKPLPEPPHWSKALGVGIVAMGLAIGTGELILWPHLIAKFGYGLLWAALIGITLQYFINQEVARHALSTGESFFSSTTRLFRWFAPFWALAMAGSYIWPGWASAIGTMLKELFGFGNHIFWAWGALFLILLLTFSGRVAYVILERTLKIIVPLFFMLLVIVSFFNLGIQDLRDAFFGLLKFGRVPENIDLNVLLSAIVFAGAGGMLNLCISLWYRDKQAGMGIYAGRITNPITGKSESTATNGFSFETNEENMRRWKKWMRFVRVDQGIIFWFLGLVTLLLLSINARATLAPKGLVPEGMQVAILQANIFGDQWGIFGYKLFLAMAALMLFSVLWTIIDAFVRTISDILFVNSHAGPWQEKLSFIKRFSLSEIYYGLIVGFVVLSATLLPLKQPFGFLVISAILGGLTMAVYTPLLLYINNFQLPKKLRPSIFTNIFMSFASLFYIWFAIKVVLQYI